MLDQQAQLFQVPKQFFEKCNKLNSDYRDLSVPLNLSIAVYKLTRLFLEP